MKDNPVDKLWWFAQLERGIETADIDREPMVGWRDTVYRIMNVSKREKNKSVKIGVKTGSMLGYSDKPLRWTNNDTR